MEADLHVHTIYSDGTVSPHDIVAIAKAAGLGAIAITDHDTVEGIEPAIAAGRKNNLEIIPGIELGAEYQDQEFHILGYLIDIYNREFLARLSSIRSDRELRIENMVKRLRELGFPVTLDLVKSISGKGSIGRPHLAAAMVKTGMVKSSSEAFDLYIGHGRPAYIPRTKITPYEAVKIIRSCGGVAVLAHPGLHNSQAPLEELITAGIAGLEVYHPGHSKEKVIHFKQLAEEKGLIATGGSDFHGPGHRTGSSLGLVTVSHKVIDDLKAKKSNYDYAFSLGR